ncbi:MAG TPA: cytochrome c maturation protein CcmE [Anaerolineaceae bacterium]|jgi:cytochrome c-type biogenesis protein CcmE|nr:cytochrome c maturation protein CcmE [Longilinea sp.]HOD45022.1 cytochrome c maturation protein CcmE [Anaerolineaceae bacterium]HOH19244.1 cytochrome c maturation protein CcmE [Anaerolineaceae bacterium]HOU42979.1 cytochrome c maturation protein CcmE [Anaerolineaceae bacterium]HPA32011.1 cytochrome c maturation protein CcmE [Anaerolineaceae bacterium]
MENPAPSHPSTNRVKFIIGGVLIAVAVLYLIISNTSASSQYYLTVAELQERKTEMMGRDLRVSGAVLGETIVYDPQTLTLQFTVVHIPGDNKEIERLGGLALVLHEATLNPNLPALQVVYVGVKPDLLKNEAQAIMSGRINENGVFEATELLLKCPSRYEEAVPNQAETGNK